MLAIRSKKDCYIAVISKRRCVAALVLIVAGVSVAAIWLHSSLQSLLGVSAALRKENCQANTDVVYVSIRDPVMPEQVEEIAKLRCLTWLMVHSKEFDSRYSKIFGNARALCEVHIVSPMFDDESLEVLCRGCPQLRILSCAACRISDHGIAQLESLRLLEFVDLSDNILTDSSAEVLARMPQLKTVILNGTKLTPDGLRTIKRTIPNVQFYVKGEPWEQPSRPAEVE